MLLFTGTAPALITPFDVEGNLDESALRRLIDRQIEGGVEGLVILGTTGENPTITHDERRRIVELSLEHTDGRVPVIVGTGTNDTRDAVHYSKEAADAGADGLLVVGPYYNKPTQAGYRAHFRAVAAATDCPIILYNVPGRTGSNITAETTLELAETVPTIIGTKEASGSLAQISDILAGRPDDFAVYAGDDEIALPIIALGADGVISVVSNVIPDAFSAMIRQALAGEFTAARAEHLRLLEPMRACFYESNPAPVKAILAEMGLIEPTLRLPLVPVTEATLDRLRDVFSINPPG